MTTGFLDGRDDGELSDLEDGYDDDRFLEDYRRKRLAEMRGAQDARLRRLHEGPAEVLFIRRDDFVKQVTEASLATPEHARGRWVVVFLFKDGRIFYHFEGFRESALLDVLAQSGAVPTEEAPAAAAAQEESEEEDERSNLV